MAGDPERHSNQHRIVVSTLCRRVGLAGKTLAPVTLAPVTLARVPAALMTARHGPDRLP